MSKQSKRRKLARMRACLLDGKPWSIMPSAFASIQEAVSAGDWEAITASLSFGGQDAETSTRIINGVAVIPVVGILRDAVDYCVRYGYASSYQVLEREYTRAVDNPQIKAVIGYFDTPGGSAIGIKRLADLVFNMRGTKPLVAYVQSVCGSAGYYFAAAHDRIEATADSMIGSVGSIYTHMELSGMLEEFGVGATVFVNKDSPKKKHGNSFEPLSSDARKTLQDFTDSYGRPFIEDVAKYRNMAPDSVIAGFDQGDAMRADIVITRGMIDAVVSGFSETISGLSDDSEAVPVEETDEDETPVVTGQSQKGRSTMDPKVKAQLFALGLIDSLEASDEVCKVALKAWFRGESVPEDASAILAALQQPQSQTDPPEDPAPSDPPPDDPPSENAPKGEETPPGSSTPREHPEHAEARLSDLRAAADLVNRAAGYEAVTSAMIFSAFDDKLQPKKAMEAWNKKLAEDESPIPTNRINVTGEGADRYASDIVEALAYRAGAPYENLSDNAQQLSNRPLWAVAGECLQMAGQRVDMFGDKELIATQAMEMGQPGRRFAFYSANEERKYISAAGVPAARPGDFPNILSSLANKFLDTIQLDDDYSFPEVSAVLPGGLNDFKPASMVNKGIVEELDELKDAETFTQLGLSEEILSYLFLRRFGNKWGWTPVLIANDDMNAFAEGMLGLNEAWMVTQNRLVVEQYTANATLLDSSALFANRTDVGSATNHNIVTGGAAPSDAQWALMETAYADIGGINTARRVRGALNVCFCPTGAVYQAARRTFFNYQLLGESKQAATTANVGLYRGQVKTVPESELRASSSIIWYGLRSPTRLKTATVVRAYFNGFGTAGRRERWYDPENKTTWVSLEGRIAVAVKNWRFAVRNAGTGA
jgi:ClpP class serine protease